MKVLVVNAGSSTVKYAVVESDSGEAVADGIVDRTNLGDTRMIARAGVGPGRRAERPAPELSFAGEALRAIARELVEGRTAVLESLDEIDAVGHRVVQGGEAYTEPVLINEKVKDKVRELSALAPLHNPVNLAGIEAAQALIPARPHVAVFDTAFHSTMPTWAHLYPLPVDFARERLIRRYGFHGTSHRYVSERARRMLGDPGRFKVVTAHIGNGASLAAVRDGKCVDTTMGMTPLEGLMMGTRSGSVDPALVVYLIEKCGMSAKEVDSFLNKKCGLLGVAGVGSGDLRDILAARAKGNERARLAFDMYVYRIALGIGAMAAALDGADAIAFTAGAGERSAELRAAVSARLGYLGVSLDPARNESGSGDRDVSADDARCRVLVIGTREDILIARETARVAGGPA